MRPIRVLVVDDSALFRNMLSQILDSDPMIHVVATAADPYQARDMIIRYEPDVMTLDVEMPRMDGIAFLKRLMPQHPIPTVMISSLNSAVFDAMANGAVDFVDKPQGMNNEQLGAWIRGELITKIKIASTVKVGKYKAAEEFKVNSTGRQYPDKVVAIGASTGGTEAIYNVVKRFNVDIPGTVIVQHMPPGFTKMYAERLNNQCRVAAKEAENGDILERGKILIAPGDKHMRLVKSGNVYRVECKEGEKVNGHCPSVDVLFRSVANVAASNALGVILTGMGGDGALGLSAMRKAGAHTIGQDEKSCVVYGMPKVAFDIGAVEYQVPLENIAAKVYNILNSIP